MFFQEVKKLLARHWHKKDKKRSDPGYKWRKVQHTSEHDTSMRQVPPQCPSIKCKGKKGGWLSEVVSARLLFMDYVVLF